MCGSICEFGTRVGRKEGNVELIQRIGSDLWCRSHPTVLNAFVEQFVMQWNKVFRLLLFEIRARERCSLQLETWPTSKSFPPYKI